MRILRDGVVAPPPGAGTQPSITCAAGSISISPGASIQAAVNLNAGNTTFCLRAGVHYLTSSIRPKTGNTFVGEYGAILDGSGWTTADDTQAAFRAHNEDIDYVTIRNLVIREMPQQGIHAYYWMSDHWTIEYNEIASNKMGLEVAPNFTIRNNYIHHNVGNASSSNPAERGGGYLVVRADNTTFDSNEIAYNGPEQKVGQSANVTFRNNFVHHNVYAGNPVRHQHQWGHTHRRQPRRGQRKHRDCPRGQHRRHDPEQHRPPPQRERRVFLSMSQNAQIYSNTLEANFGGIAYFLNCDSLSLGEDVKNNAAYDNTVVVGTQTYAYASGFSYVLVHLNTGRAISEWFEEPDLLPQRVPRAITLWPVHALGGWKYWNEWQALGHDIGGSMAQ